MTSVLTVPEIEAIKDDTSPDWCCFARAIEVAVIRKLSTKINVEPVMAYECDGASVMYAPMNHPDQLPIGKHTLFTLDQLTTAIAAARVTALEEAADPTDDQLVKGVKAMHLFVTNNSVADFKLGYIAAIHALLGKEAQS